MVNGINIVIEGPDLSGKSTMALRLVEWLKEREIPAIYTRHPGATQIGKELRKILASPDIDVDKNTRALLFAVDNSAYVASILKPAMSDGAWVVADRNNFISSLAYQIADGTSIDQLDAIHAATYPIDDIPKIDLLLLMNIDYETAKHRRESGRNASEKAEHFEKKMSGFDYFTKIANAYSSLVDKQKGRLSKYVKSSNGSLNCMYIDATKSQENVFDDIKNNIAILVSEPTNTQ
jgi:dTMP kinase